MNNVATFIMDANSFITPFKQYYAFDLIPAYWNELEKHIAAEHIVILDIVKTELEKGEDELTSWLENTKNLVSIPHKDSTIISKYQEIMQYVSDCGKYLPSAFHSWAINDVADPWLIATAAINNYILITEEVPSGGLSTKTPNKKAKIPDIAEHFGVKTGNVYYMMRELNIIIK